MGSQRVGHDWVTFTFIFKALRSSDRGGEISADVSLLCGQAVNPQATDLSSIRSGFEIYQQILIDWLRTHIQGFFTGWNMEELFLKKVPGRGAYNLLFHFSRACSENQLNSFLSRFLKMIHFGFYNFLALHHPCMYPRPSFKFHSLVALSWVPVLPSWLNGTFGQILTHCGVIFLLKFCSKNFLGNESLTIGAHNPHWLLLNHSYFLSFQGTNYASVLSWRMCTMEMEKRSCPSSHAGMIP